MFPIPPISLSVAVLSNLIGQIWLIGVWAKFLRFNLANALIWSFGVVCGMALQLWPVTLVNHFDQDFASRFTYLNRQGSEFR